jgi:hypothetical protein
MTETETLRTKYLILTLGFLLPLSWAFLKERNLYPIASWNVMTSGGQLEYGRTYFVLRGETVSGEQIDIPAIELSGAMRSRIWGMVEAIADNQSLKIDNPHPQNLALLNQLRGQAMPDGLLMNQLLKSWGATYNYRLPPSSPERLKAIRIDSYRWPGQTYSNFYQFMQTWRADI